MGDDGDFKTISEVGDGVRAKTKNTGSCRCGWCVVLGDVAVTLVRGVQASLKGVFLPSVGKLGINGTMWNPAGIWEVTVRHGSSFVLMLY